MSQPLSWWKGYYANLIWQGVLTDMDEIENALEHLITEAQQPFNVANYKKELD